MKFPSVHARSAGSSPRVVSAGKISAKCSNKGCARARSLFEISSRIWTKASLAKNSMGFKVNERCELVSPAGGYFFERIRGFPTHEPEKLFDPMSTYNVAKTPY